jgi:hypothetical protein
MHSHYGSSRRCLVAVIILCVLAGLARPATYVQALSRPMVTVTPNVVGAAAAYAISFTAERALGTDSGVTLQFPPGTELPCTSCNPYVAPQKILINGQNPTRAGYGDRYTMTIVVYMDTAVAAGDRVDIVLASTVGIKNPVRSGMYSLSVWTGTEQTPVRSEEFAIGESRLSSVAVRPDVGMAGATSGYHIEFITGANGGLTADTDDTIVMSFPSTFLLPQTLSTTAVLVNSRVSRSVDIDTANGKVVVGVSSSIGPLTAVTVDIAGVPGIANPSSQGSYYVLVRTSRDLGDVASLPFSILAKPAVSSYSSIVPTAPDGDGGWFINTPLVSLEGQSNAAGDVVVEWSLDGGEFGEYLKPVSIPDGVHTLAFRARNDAASLVETETHSIAFRVDTKQPRVEFDPEPSPRPYSANPVVVRGRAIRGASSLVGLEFGGRPILPRSDGWFEEQFTLTEGDNRLLLIVRSESGRNAAVEWGAILDTTPPALSITSPRNWQKVAEPRLTVTGIAERGATVTCQGQAVEGIGADGTWDYPVNLEPGQNIVTATAIDVAGNRRIATVVVMYERQSSTVVLAIGDKSMMVNGTKQEIDPGRGTVPVIQNGRTLVPVAAIIQALGGQVAWDAAARTVTITMGDTELVLTIGSPMARVNGTSMPIDADPKVVPVIINSRTMLPFRFIAEQLGATVEWNGATRTVVIRMGAA